MADDLPWVKLSFDDLFKDTTDLTNEEFGAYVRLFGHLYRPKYSGRVVDDPERLRRLAQCDRDEWDRIAPVVRPFFKVEAGVLRHDRVIREVADRAGRVQQAKDAVNKRWDTERSTDSNTSVHTAAIPANIRSEIGDLRSEISENTREIPARAHMGDGKWYADAWLQRTGFIPTDGTNMRLARIHSESAAITAGADLQTYSIRILDAFIAFVAAENTRNTSRIKVGPASLVKHFDSVLASIAVTERAEPERLAIPTAEELRERLRRDREARGPDDPNVEIPKIDWGQS